MSMVVAVVGATGVVGREVLRTLERRDFEADRVIALASPRSAGARLSFRDEPLAVEALGPESLKDVNIAIFCAPSAVSREYAPIAVANGAVVIDDSNAWRMDSEVPLVVPEVNPEAVMARRKGIVANPTGSAIQLVVALKPLHDAARLAHVVVSTYQAVSDNGHAAIEELRRQTRQIAAGEEPTVEVFPTQVAMNLGYDRQAGSQGYSEEELALADETRRVLGDSTIGVTPTCIRVPVVTGHSESVHVRCHEPLSRERVRELLANAPGVRLVDEGDLERGQGAEPLMAASTDPVYVARIRDDLAVPGAVNLWIVADNLRKGAALNAVQIAELIA